MKQTTTSLTLKFERNKITALEYIRMAHECFWEAELDDIANRIHGIACLYGEGDDNSFFPTVIDEENMNEFAILITTMLGAVNDWNEMYQQLDELYSAEIDRLF